MKRIVLLMLLVGANAAYAQTGGALSSAGFRFEAPESWGKVVVRGHQNDKSEIGALTITAWGRDYLVPPEKLAKLGAWENGVRMSNENESGKAGSRTIDIQLQMDFTSSTKKEAMITVQENGTIEVGEVRLGGAHAPTNATSTANATNAMIDLTPINVDGKFVRIPPESPMFTNVVALADRLASSNGWGHATDVFWQAEGRRYDVMYPTSKLEWDWLGPRAVLVTTNGAASFGIRE